jgi:methionine synthase II (cobalamin-independent)
MNVLLPTCLVGSYSQPDWLIDRARLGERLPPRVRALELWRVPPAHLEEAQNDATIVALEDQHRDDVDACVAHEISLECAQPRVNLELLRLLPSKRIHVGVIDLRDLAIESPQIVAQRIRDALQYLPAERLVIAPDCGMKYLPRDVAFGKLCNMVRGRDLVRAELNT